MQQPKNAFDWSAKYYIKLIIICSKKISLFAQLFVIVLYRTKTKKNQNLYEKILLLVSFLIITSYSQAQTLNDFFEQTNEFLKKNVSPEGKVNYAQLKKSPGELIYILDHQCPLKIKKSSLKLL